MKVRINLAQPESRLERTVYWWAPIIILIAVALLVRLGFVAGRQLVEYRKVHRAVMQYQAEVQEIQMREDRLQVLLRQPATLRLYGQINFVNSLIEQKRVSLSRLTVEVAKLLPAEVRITGLSLADTAKGPVIEISVEGSVNQVTGEFLGNLESSPDFDTVAVLDQAFEQQNPQNDLVSLTCSARFIGKTLPGLDGERAQP